MSEPRTFRDRAVKAFLHELGPAEEIETESGTMYRWRLTRPGRTDLHIYVTLDSPELTFLAHVMISDASCARDDPLTSTVIRAEDDLPRVLADVRRRVIA